MWFIDGGSCIEGWTNYGKGSNSGEEHYALLVSPHVRIWLYPRHYFLAPFAETEPYGDVVSA